ncbi:MAG: glycoside hydrolase family 19 protein [Methylococcales bacterium]|nr:glycoside hydrolase family 19 protein [Methylococcales bacterium]MCK5924593.1 glycoside hydrolase family 19 protein [Methylococcales bacterium]
MTVTNSLFLEPLKTCLPEHVFNQIPACLETFEINTPLRLAHFLSQCDYESANFSVTEENLNYSVIQLKRRFKKYFRNNLAKKYAHQPEKIGARIYAGRIGNGSEATKEGAMYRGRGYIQLRGKSNYSAFNPKVDEDILIHPALVAEKYALFSAAWYWNSCELNTIADEGANKCVVKKVTHKMTGGFSEIIERVQIFNKYYAPFI